MRGVGKQKQMWLCAHCPACYTEKKNRDGVACEPYALHSYWSTARPFIITPLSADVILVSPLMQHLNAWEQEWVVCRTQRMCNCNLHSLPINTAMVQHFTPRLTLVSIVLIISKTCEASLFGDIPLLKRGRCLGKPKDGGLEALDEKRVIQKYNKYSEWWFF